MHDAAPLRTQGGSDTDLPRALGDREGHQRVDAGGREREQDTAENSGAPVQPLSEPPAEGKDLIERLEAQELSEEDQVIIRAIKQGETRVLQYQ